MKRNLTIKQIKMIFILLSIIILIFIGLNICGYRCYSVSSNTLDPVYKSGDLIYVKEDLDETSDISLKDSRKLEDMSEIKIIRFPLLGYIKNFFDSSAGKTVIAISTILLILLYL